MFVPSSFISVPQLNLEVEELSNHLQTIWGQGLTIEKVLVSADSYSNVDTILIIMTYFYHKKSVYASIPRRNKTYVFT